MIRDFNHSNQISTQSTKLGTPQLTTALFNDRHSSPIVLIGHRIICNARDLKVSLTEEDCSIEDMYDSSLVSNIRELETSADKILSVKVSKCDNHINPFLCYYRKKRTHKTQQKHTFCYGTPRM